MRSPKKMTISVVEIDLLKSLYNDIADITSTTLSGAIEDTLLNYLLPSNPDAKSICVSYLYGDYQNRVKKTLSALYNNNAAGVNFEAVYDNFDDLIRFTLSNYNYSQGEISVNNPLIHHANRNFTAVIEKVEFEHTSKFSENETLSQEKFDSQQKVKFAKDIFDIFKSDIESGLIQPISIYDVLLQNWDVLKNFTYTYRLLYDIVELSPDSYFVDDAKARLELLKVIKEISTDWK